jgi:hypothetical protein
MCNITCCKKDDMKRHLLTKKHIKRIGNQPEIKNYAKEFICTCGKKYNTNSGLWKHTKICKNVDNSY